MSVWGEIRRKSLGQEKRIEDTWNRDFFPHVENVYSKTIASRIVSVQPMAPPTGAVFFCGSKSAEQINKAIKNWNETKNTKKNARNNKNPRGIYQLS